jgi:hypothetical protein
MEAANSSKMLVPIYDITRLHTPWDRSSKAFAYILFYNDHSHLAMQICLININQIQN